MKRALIESLEGKRDAMIASLWANSNWDDDKGTRQKAIEDLENSYEEAMVKIRTGAKEEELDKSNPFISAVDRGMAKIAVPRNDEGGTVAEVVNSQEIVDYTKDIDQ